MAATQKRESKQERSPPDPADVKRRCDDFLSSSTLRLLEHQRDWADTCMKAAWLAMTAADDSDAKRYFVITAPSWHGRSHAIASVTAALLDANAPLRIAIVVENMYKMLQMRNQVQHLCVCAATAKKLAFIVQTEPERSRGISADLVIVDAFAHDQAFFKSRMPSIIMGAKAAVVFVTQKDSTKK